MSSFIERIVSERSFCVCRKAPGHDVPLSPSDAPSPKRGVPNHGDQQPDSSPASLRPIGTVGSLLNLFQVRLAMPIAEKHAAARGEGGCPVEKSWSLSLAAYDGLTPAAVIGTAAAGAPSRHATVSLKVTGQPLHRYSPLYCMAVGDDRKLSHL